MRHVSEVVGGAVGRGGPAPLNDQERDSVAYFFAKFAVVDFASFKQLMPDVSAERAVKREYANMLRGFSREQIDLGFAGLKRAQALGCRDFRFPKVAQIIGLVRSGGRLPDESGRWARAGIYRESRPERLIESAADKQRRREVGVRECEKLLSMFDEGVA